MIDLCDHKHGPTVYDEGLHGFQKEPGYLASAKAAFDVAAKYIGQKTTVAIYKEIHKAACSHFDTNDLPSEVMLDGCDAGKFTRGRLYSADFDQRSHDPQATKQQWYERLDKVQDEIDALYKKLGLTKPLVTIYHKPNDYLQVVYTHFKDEELETAAAILFDRFHKKAQVLQEKSLEKESYKAAIRRTIAKLFQRLEWLHPFPDGQGRTDLILQAKLLTDYGLHPPLLRMSYDSSIFPLDEWAPRLLLGLKNWEQENHA